MSAPSPPWHQEALAAQLLDALAVPAWLHRDGQPLHANPALLRLSGLTPATLPQATHLGLVAADDRDTLAAATTACLHSGAEPPVQAAQLLTGAGQQRPVALTLRRMDWAGTAAVLVTCIDHNDMLQVQTMLQATGGLLRQIVDSGPVATFVIDRHHRVTHWNGACARLTGHSAEQMMGSNEAWRAFYPTRQPLLADLILARAGTRLLRKHYGNQARASALVPGAFEAESFFPQLGPEGRWLNFTAAPLRDQDGQVSGAVVTLQDVSAARRTEADLTHQLEQLVAARSAELAAHARVMDAFIDHAPIGVVYARDEQVLRSNRRMRQIFGASAPGSADDVDPDNTTADGRNFHLDPADAAALREVARPLLARGKPLHTEMWLHDAAGMPLWVQVNAYVVQHPGDDDATAGTGTGTGTGTSTGTGIWWMLQDRTEVRAAQAELRSRFEQLQATNEKLEQAQNQLLQSDKMASIGQLAAGVAHEINNPVAFVSSNLHTLRQYVSSLLQLADAYAARDSTPDDLCCQAALRQALAAAKLEHLKEDLPQLLEESADGLARVKKIVQDLKDFSRVDQAAWQQADLNAGLESTLNVVRNELKYKCTVDKRLQPLPLVTCLAGQLNQVFMNLIVNASQAMAVQGTVTLRSGHVGDWAWVQVDDTGSGMPEAVVRRIFEPFYTTKAVGKGTGLGLSLSFSIVKRHGGLIQVRSTPGVGSSFRVWVPVGGPTAAGVAAAEPPPWPPD